MRKRTFIKSFGAFSLIPFFNVVFADQPSLFSFELSNNFLGVPSGFDESQIIFP